jgi:hypothetical protein
MRGIGHCRWSETPRVFGELRERGNSEASLHIRRWTCERGGEGAQESIIRERCLEPGSGLGTAA